MAITNHDRISKMMELVRDGLAPFIEREFTSTYKDQALSKAAQFVPDERQPAKTSFSKWDSAALLRLMWESWNDVFRKTLGHAERSLVSELRDIRNRWAHQNPFS